MTKVVLSFFDKRNKNFMKNKLPSYGVGVIGTKYPITYKDEFNKHHNTKEYSIWQNMLRRCYDVKTHNKQPTYTGCSVSENFKSYEYFYEWCQDQIGFLQVGWHFDKDLLIKGNKIYSEDTCIFLPPELNMLLTNRASLRGELPIGVSYKKNLGKFSSQVNRNNRRPKHLGYFSTPKQAFDVYKQTKEEYIKEQALIWKDKIDPRAFEALMNYTVDITD